MSPRYGLIVEGPEDREALKKLFERLRRLRPRVRTARGNGNLRRKIESYIELLLNRNCDKIIVLKDLDDEDLNELQNEVRPRLHENARFCVAVQSIESWFLADDQALAEVLESSISPIHNPEDIREPKDKIRRIFRQHGKPYIAQRDLPELAGKIRLAVLREMSKF
ncbi:MAG: DUF4276 family protein [Candidatus Bathyarchaeia archaeon]